MSHYPRTRAHTHAHTILIPASSSESAPVYLCRSRFLCGAIDRSPGGSLRGLGCSLILPCRFVSCFSLGSIILIKGSRGQVLRGEVTEAVFDSVGVGDTGGAEGKVEVEGEGEAGDAEEAEAGADAGAERMADGNDNDDDNAGNAE